MGTLPLLGAGPGSPSGSLVTAFTFIDSVTAASPDGHTFSTGAINTTNAGLLIVGVSDYSFPVVAPVLTDSKGNSWTPLTAAASPGGAQSLIYYSVPPPAKIGSGHTVSLTGSGFYGAATFVAFAGGAAIPFDAENGDSGIPPSVTASASAGITPGEDGELVIFNVCSYTGDPNVVDGSFIPLDIAPYIVAQNLAHGLAYLIQTNAALADPDYTLTAGSDWGASIASFEFS